jgi:lysophospholipid acyltransferase (LPLAT)-like uncharacterized protein
MSFVRRLTRSRAFQRVLGTVAAEWLRLVWLTNRWRVDPPDIYDDLDRQLPVIVAFWHGQHFMMPFLKKKRHRAKVLISRHRDGEMNAIAAERLGVGTVRGSGSHEGEFHRKGGVSAFKGMVSALEEGYNMALTADVPKVSRVAGLGIIMLARQTGRPIVPVVIATSRFKRLNNWDRTIINLPFGRGVMLAGDPVRVPPESDDAAMEDLRAQLQDNLNDATRRAYEMIGCKDAPASRERGNA